MAIRSNEIVRQESRIGTIARGEKKRKFLNLPSELFLQLFLLEEVRERKYDHYARKIQKCWRRFRSDLYFDSLKKQGTVRGSVWIGLPLPHPYVASSIVMNKKERRYATINRNFAGDYIGIDENPALKSLIGLYFFCLVRRLLHLFPLRREKREN